MVSKPRVNMRMRNGSLSKLPCHRDHIVYFFAFYVSGYAQWLKDCLYKYTQWTCRIPFSGATQSRGTP